MCAALLGVLASKCAFLPSILLLGSRRLLVGAPHSPGDFKSAVRVAHPYSELGNRASLAIPTCPARYSQASLPWAGWRTPRARIWHGGARREVRVDRMTAAIGETQISHYSRPPVTGRNLAPINGCRTSECGGEEESTHDV
jgi:hypothetical protein